MIQAEIQQSEAALRRAVEQRRFPQVESLTVSFCKLADAALGKLAADDPSRVELLTRVIGMLRWTHLMLATSRSECSDRLREIVMTKRYVESGSNTSSSISSMQFDL